MAGVDINRTTSGVSLPKAVSDEIWTNVVEQSVVTRVAKRIALPGSGAVIPMVTAEASASWVNETDEKPVSRPTISNKTISAYKLALIVPFSNEFRRDLGTLYQAMVDQLPAAIGKKFDQTVFGYASAPGADFDTLASAPTVSLNTGTTVYDSLVSAFGLVASNGGSLSHWVMGDQGQVKLLGAKDGDGRPLLIQNAQQEGLIGQLLGRPVVGSRNVYKADTTGTAGGVNAETVGIAGDWADSAVWGQVGPIDVSVSDQATINDNGTALNLWQRNMFAVRVEVEVGFRVKAVNRFVRLIGADLGT